MTLAIDPVARTLISIEVPAGISQGDWYCTTAAGPGGDVGTVFISTESERDILRSARSRNSYHQAVIQHLRSLLGLDQDWDSYGAPAISPVAAERAIGFLLRLPTQSRPSVVPTAKGGVQLEWHGGDIDVEVECLPSGHAQLFAEDGASGKTEERWVVPGHPALEVWLGRIRGQS